MSTRIRMNKGRHAALITPMAQRWRESGRLLVLTFRPFGREGK
jgi:hypothetical protein